LFCAHSEQYAGGRRRGEDHDGPVRGRGRDIGDTYLVHDRLRECLTHVVRFLERLVGEEACGVGEFHSVGRGHGFVIRLSGVVGCRAGSGRTAAAQMN
jgi:hypothetical protein